MVQELFVYGAQDLGVVAVSLTRVATVTVVMDFLAVHAVKLL